MDDRGVQHYQTVAMQERLHSVYITGDFGDLGLASVEVEYEEDGNKPLISALWLIIGQKFIDLLGMSNRLDDAAYEAAIDDIAQRRAEKQEYDHECL